MLFINTEVWRRAVVSNWAQRRILCSVVGRVQKQLRLMLRPNAMCVAQLVILFAVFKIARVKVCGSWTAARLSAI